MLLFGAGSAQAQAFTTLYNFTGGSDGGSPYAAVIEDSSGNLYGTTFNGGDMNCPNDGAGCGVVYEIDSAGSETVLHAFTDDPDGDHPAAALVQDAEGNLYGTTERGGEGNDGTKTCGIVFALDTAGDEAVLYAFEAWGCGGHHHPAQPMGGLLLDSSGNLYGTASACGHGGGSKTCLGAVFEVSAGGTYVTLHQFAKKKSDGARPTYGNLVMDNTGSLYGVTLDGGSADKGVVYRLAPNGKLTVLYSFRGGTKDGCYPDGTLAVDAAGNFYGTTRGCGSSNHGMIWRVTKKGKETVLHNFAGGTSDGCSPLAGVVRDPEGDLYGATLYCGANGDGALYELNSGGVLTLLHSFDGSDGEYPYGGLLLDANGVLYGTTSAGGGGGEFAAGTVWSYVP